MIGAAPFPLSLCESIYKVPFLVCLRTHHVVISHKHCALKLQHLSADYRSQAGCLELVCKLLEYVHLMLMLAAPHVLPA